MVLKDSKVSVDLYTSIFRNRGFYVLPTSNWVESVQRYMQELDKIGEEDILPFDAIIIDYSTPLQDRVRFIKKILKEKPDQRIIFISPAIKAFLEDLRRRESSLEFLSQPFSLGGLISLEDILSRPIEFDCNVIVG